MYLSGELPVSLTGENDGLCAAVGDTPAGVRPALEQVAGHPAGARRDSMRLMLRQLSLTLRKIPLTLRKLSLTLRQLPLKLQQCFTRVVDADPKNFDMDLDPSFCK